MRLTDQINKQLPVAISLQHSDWMESPRLPWGPPAKRSGAKNMTNDWMDGDGRG